MCLDEYISRPIDSLSSSDTDEDLPTGHEGQPGRNDNDATMLPKIVHGVRINNERVHYRPRQSWSSFVTDSSSSSFFTNMSSTATTPEEVNSTPCSPVDPDAMIIYDVHDTIRQVDLPKKKKKPPITKRRTRLEVKNLDPQKIADCRRHRCNCLTKCASKFTFEDIERERGTYIHTGHLTNVHKSNTSWTSSLSTSLPTTIHKLSSSDTWYNTNKFAALSSRLFTLFQ